ncbi:MAG: 30S ribosomal protein S2 [Candidatus Omnitrophica bacterium 4484_171]|nr:MAG: 30S ribosomal protein S2 [Candidatus Omnitrophica bacterium 4484_171]
MALPDIIKDLLENGVHFGHLSKHWNPKMKRFIFGKKKNIYIIDLEKTAQKIEEAKDFVKKIASGGGKILFVATKKQLKDTIENLAVSCGMPYIVERWIGGFLTNSFTIQERIRKYIELKDKREKGQLGKVSNKELLRINREFDKMTKHYRGVVSLEGLPDCIYIVDPKREAAAVREARKLGIPIVALIDTDSDPETIDYPIPGNDDAIKSVKYVTVCLRDAILEGIEEGTADIKEKKSDGSSEDDDNGGDSELRQDADKEKED